MSEHPVGTPNDVEAAALARCLGPSREAGERLQLLRMEVHDSLNEGFQLVADDLEQLHGILTDAAQKLSGVFGVVSASTAELNEVIVRIADDPADASLAKLHRIAGDIHATAGTTIQGLQFEDMASQLLAHVHRRLGTVRDFSVEMSVINPTASHTPPFLTPEELISLFARLEHYRHALRVSTRKVVQQQSLESGDVELF